MAKCCAVVGLGCDEYLLLADVPLTGYEICHNVKLFPPVVL